MFAQPPKIAPTIEPIPSPRKRPREAGVFDQILFDNVAQVLVVRDMLRELYHADGGEQQRNIADCRAVYLILISRFDGL